jgi:hypothetical protein
MRNNKYCAIIIDCRGIPLLARSDSALGRVECPTQENAADLHSAGKGPVNTRDGVGGEQRDPIKKISPHHCMTFFPLVAIC